MAEGQVTLLSLQLTFLLEDTVHHMPGETGWQNCQDLPGRERVSGVIFGLGGHQRDLSKRLRIKLKWVLLGVAAWVPIKI